MSDNLFVKILIILGFELGLLVLWILEFKKLSINVSKGIIIIDVARILKYFLGRVRKK